MMLFRHLHHLSTDTSVRTPKHPLARDSPHAPLRRYTRPADEKVRGRSATGSEQGTLALPRAAGPAGRAPTAGTSRAGWRCNSPEWSMSDVRRCVVGFPSLASRRAALHEAGTTTSVSALCRGVPAPKIRDSAEVLLALSADATEPRLSRHQTIARSPMASRHRSPPPRGYHGIGQGRGGNVI